MKNVHDALTQGGLFLIWEPTVLRERTGLSGLTGLRHSGLYGTR